MRPVKFHFALLAVCLCFFGVLSSCTKDNVAAPAVENAVQDPSAIDDMSSVRANPNPGRYTITRYVEDGTVKTSHFNGYVFIFRNDGAFIAKKSGNTYNGRWDIENDDDDREMDLNISGTAALNDLDDDDWDIERMTDNVIRLEEDDDVVIFTRIQ